MKFSQFMKLPVVDAHVHFGGSTPKKDQFTAEKLEKLGEFMIDVIKNGMLSQMNITGGYAGLYLKIRYPGFFYAGGYVPWSGDTQLLKVDDWNKYIESLIDTGFDGIGEMGNKPVPRNKHHPLNGKYYEGFWDACEILEVPVLCHVADPEEFWDTDRAPEWAKSRGWVYYSGNYPAKEELYAEMESVLDTHPNLKVVLCHFYFISANLERAERFMNRYENANLDLTLGIELMYNISRRRDDWREFFIKYQDRIIFGTDIATWQTLQEALDRIWLIRNFLESDEEFFTPDTADMLLTRYKEPFVGLKLPDGVLRKIYHDNFKRLWGEKPRDLNIDMMMKHLERENERELIAAIKKTVKSGDS
ncbi:hypothetical protein DRO35_03305 [Candidatus Bathyarchaeota archaeon]|nr:MAG: hypothetical protein DRO35_03305 [Candidatus Bathyarchaeota archaeon]